MEKYIDLHSHSSYSDGLLNVSELVSAAKNSGVSLFSVTDHDDIRSISDIKKYSGDSSIKLIKGLELSTEIKYGNDILYLHLLGYDFNENDERLLEILDRMRLIRYQSNKMFIESLYKNNIPIPECILNEIDYYSYMWIFDQIRLILARNGYSVDFINDFINLTTAYEPLYPDYEINVLDAIDLVLSSGGIPVLAHPNRIKISSKEQIKLIEELKNHGLMGLESYHSSSTKESISFYKELSRELHLLESVGSDFHYPTTEDNVIIGLGINNNLKQQNCSLKDYILRR